MTEQQDQAPTATEGLLRELVIDALQGVGLPSPTFAVYATKAGLARFTGNQHNEAWSWNRTALEAMPLEKLQDLYLAVKNHKAGS